MAHGERKTITLDGENVRNGRFGHLTMDEFKKSKLKMGYTSFDLFLWKAGSMNKREAHITQDNVKHLADLVRSARENNTDLPFISYVTMEADGNTKNYGGGFVKLVMFTNNSPNVNFSRPGNVMDGMEPAYWVLQCPHSKRGQRPQTFSINFNRMINFMLKPTETKKSAAPRTVGDNEFKIRKTGNGFEIIHNEKKIRVDGK